ncbi:MAG: crossover junction endodeoxyribonuclease RuvC, partial [Bacteroidia bacterium]|nr:crossover junction endodeoxyribonuclease RuvC [Bacteroidia bacterium]
FLIDEYQPECMALEAQFFGKNVQSMLKLGRAQGVAMSAGLANNLSVHEYAPKKVKQSVTGNGNASKEQVAAMLQQILNFTLTPKFLDATDGLAVALCHHYQENKIVGDNKSYSGWKSFVDQNPDKTI